ncbi:hypothetical protein F2Q68_00032300 [Brassica cretica]|uniref:Uncharacterized protein n=1 Tax=Brassica cretica TaxID=69181 RepID=A0A8S9GIB4_BRACR|nr:hypothetical protein F2Q68_00032300 [Brassica cretica]
MVFSRGPRTRIRASSSLEEPSQPIDDSELEILSLSVLAVALTGTAATNHSWVAANQSLASNKSGIGLLMAASLWVVRRDCDKPGSVCQDPRFIGGDGLTFYFHGKKDSNFCLISDPNLHINAHFIGKRRPGMARDFTWVQSLAVLFGTHRFYVGALKTATWDDSVDRISASLDGNIISLPQLDGATWTSSPGVYPQVSVKRVNADTNNIEVEVEGLLKITARVVSITMEDSRIHGYDVKEDDCLAHLDLGFKFQDLSDNVDGVLGQTYRPNYVSRVKIGVHMPVMGGDREFQTTGLFAPDCSAARFTGNGGRNGGWSKMELPEMSCASGVGGKGVVCKR